MLIKLISLLILAPLALCAFVAVLAFAIAFAPLIFLWKILT